MGRTRFGTGLRFPFACFVNKTLLGSGQDIAIDGTSWGGWGGIGFKVGRNPLRTGCKFPLTALCVSGFETETEEV